MVIKPAIQIGDPVIRGVAKTFPRAEIGSRASKALVRNLIDSMRFHNLVGMAAPQIGVGLRVFVTEIRRTNARRASPDKVRVFINPVIARASKRKVMSAEGCGSVAHGKLFGAVPRAERVTVTAFDGKGARFRLSAGGLLACIIQHETDHLNGIVFLDLMKDMKGLTTRE